LAGDDAHGANPQWTHDKFVTTLKNWNSGYWQKSKTAMCPLPAALKDDAVLVIELKTSANMSPLIQT